jgi:ketosteroid isomerase-like protein
VDQRADMIALCDRFFDAIENKDYKTVEACCAPEYVVWHSADNLYEPRDSNLAMLKRGIEAKTRTRYTERRVEPFEGGFVQQYRIVLEYPTGFVGQMDACFIAYVVNGKISRLYEYFDRGHRQRLIDPTTSR